MARSKSRLGRGALGVLAALGMPLAAQTLWMPASDPVGISRAGAGVAFGQSLEAAALNPALLVTLRDGTQAFVAAGMELQSAMATLQSNSTVLFSDDRNRFLPSLGAAFRLSPTFSLGLMFDSPFMRHVQTPLQYSGRFEAASMNLTTRRYAVQGAWAATPALSFGATVGITHIEYAFNNSIRVPVCDDPLEPVNAATNPARGLLELSLGEKATKNVPTWAAGFRYAMNPRWTLAGTWQAPLKAHLDLTAQADPGRQQLVGITGYGPADPIAQTLYPAMEASGTVAPGDGGITLPGRATLGLRQRLNQFFTWEADLRYVYGSTLRLPSGASFEWSGGKGVGPGFPVGQHDGFGVSVTGEFTLTKRLTGRIGLAQDPGVRNDPSVEPVFGGARSSSFAGGLGWKAFGGEVNLGWLTRVAQHANVSNLDGQWSQSGYYPSGTLTRVENLGHIWSVGFKKAF